MGMTPEIYCLVVSFYDDDTDIEKMVIRVEGETSQTYRVNQTQFPWRSVIKKSEMCVIKKEMGRVFVIYRADQVAQACAGLKTELDSIRKHAEQKAARARTAIAELKELAREGDYFDLQDRLERKARGMQRLAKEVIGREIQLETVKESMMSPTPGYEPWYNGLSDAPIKGLADKVFRYVRGWGNGGGSLSVQSAVEEALGLNETDDPKTLADAINIAAVEGGMTPREASSFTMGAIGDSMAELAGGE